MEKVILETMLSESESRERIARKVIEDLRKQVRNLKKEVKVILTPFNKIKNVNEFEKLTPKEVYKQAIENGYPVYSDSTFCKKLNYDEINTDNYYVTITKEY